MTPADWGQEPSSRHNSEVPTYAVQLVFDVLRVDLPLRDTRNSRKVWNHVDELRIDAELAGLMVRNGLRMGVGEADAWPAIDAVLIACDAKTRGEQLFAQPGLPVTIIVGTVGDGESVFVYNAKGGLVGKTFQAGEKLITMDYAFRPELGGGTDLQIHLEIRHDSGNLTWERRGDAVQQVSQMQRHIFTELAVAVTLASGEFLIIGPSEKADQASLVGSRFLTQSERSPHQFETLYRISPQPYQRRETRRPS